MIEHLIDPDFAVSPPSPEPLSGAYFYGAGGRGCALADCFARLGLEVGGFVVSDPAVAARAGTVMGKTVISLGDFVARHNGATLVTTSKFEPEMLEACARQGVEHVLTFYQALSMLGLSLSHQPLKPEDVNSESEAVRAVGVWEDADSREKYRSLVRLHFRPDSAHVPPYEPEQYFSPRYMPEKYLNAVVDAGAYDGDTLHELVRRTGGVFDAYYAFEPDPANFSILAGSKTVMDARIRIFRIGLSNLPGQLTMRCLGGLGSYLSEDGEIPVNVAKLDDILGCQPATLIKMDVEGHEEEALRGAEEIIRKQRPALAIAIYHRIEHLWKIPLWIKDLDLGYRIRLGHHSRDHDESVCYAIPEEVPNGVGGK